MIKKMLIIICIFTFALSVGCSNQEISSESKSTNSSTETTDKVDDPNKLEINSLYFDFDSSKFELVKIEGENSISLMDKEKNSNIFAAWEHIPKTDIQTETNNALSEYPTYVNAETDLDIESTKLIDCIEDGSAYQYIYFINDEKTNGVYRLRVNATDFNGWDNTQREKLLKSIKLVEKNQNSNLDNLKTIKPSLG